MVNKYTIWTNNRDASSVKAFKSALSLRKNEDWYWVEERQTADLWVLDASFFHNEVYELYLELNPKPIVAALGFDNKRLPEKWKSFTHPLSVPHIFRWLDEMLPSINTGRKKQTHISPDSDGIPWKTNEFKLAAWPNISKFGSDPNIAITCSRLLTDFHRFNDVLGWGLDNRTLDELLDDAYAHSLLQLRPIDANYTANINVTHDSHNSRSLIQKLLGRFR